MKHTTIHTLAVLFCLIAFAFSAEAQTNILKVRDCKVTAGDTVSLSFDMENTSPVVALQFNITLPDGLWISRISDIALTSRKTDGHTVRMSSASDGSYLVMAYSADNKPFTGNSGAVLTLKIRSSSSLEEGTTLDVKLSNVVLATTNGDNVLTSAVDGKVTIPMSPDLAVSNFSTTVTSISPGDTIPMSWQIQNNGKGAMEQGWQEKVWLIKWNDNLTSMEAQYELASIVHTDTIAAGAVLNRTMDIAVPEILGLDGKTYLLIDVEGLGNEEKSENLDDNQFFASNTVDVARRLYIAPQVGNITEVDGMSRTVSFTVTRSGATSYENFTIAHSADSRLRISSSGTDRLSMKSGYSGNKFSVYTIGNGKWDDIPADTITVYNDNYPPVTAIIYIEDDTKPALTLTSQQTDVTEGGTLALTIKAPKPVRENMAVSLSCDMSLRFSIPSDIVIKAGEDSVNVEVQALDDDVPDVEQVVKFTAAADGYDQSEPLFTTLLDNDVPTLTFSLEPKAVSEGDGPVCVTATVRRTDNVDKKVTIKLSDNSGGGIYYGKQEFTMDAGVEKATVTLGPVDNTIVDGDRKVVIQAGVWISSCSCNAGGTSGGVVSDTLTIYDNDGPTLSMNATSASLKEGGEITITLSRNSSAGSLTVSLTSDNDDRLEYPSSVTFAEGETTASFTVKAKDNGVSGDDFTATLTAKADGYSSGTFYFTVTDQTLPDAQITAFSLPAEEFDAGEAVDLTFTLANTGSLPLPEMTEVSISLSDGSEFTAYLQDTLVAGASVEMKKNITLPAKVGTYQVYATANAEKKVREMNYANNTSAVLTVKVVSPYTFILSTDKTSYRQGDSITISGKASGKDVANKNIDVYVINEGYRQVIKTTTTADGSFTAGYKPYDGQAGSFSVGACYPDEGSTEMLASFGIYGLRRADTKAISCEPTVGEAYNGSFLIVNPGPLSLSGSKVTVASKPEGWDVLASVPSSISGGETATVSYTFNASVASTGDEWEQVVLNVETSEGVSLPVTLYCYSRTLKGKLKSETVSINTTMTKGNTREYPITITNIGKGATGTITLALPSWMTTTTSSQLPSLGKGESATIGLQLSATDDMQLNVPVKGQIGINCENGDGLAIPFYIEPVSESTGTLTIDVCDEYTYNTTEAPHLAGATVTVKHPTTGAVLATGTTGQDGIFTTTLAEGWYAVTVTADRHDSYSNNLEVAPGKDNATTVNLSVNGVTITYDVVPTEVEDKYEIVTTTKWETRVPAPVVVINATPSEIDGENMSPGEAVIVNFAFTNHGLVRAEQNSISFDVDDSEWTVDQLSHTEPFTIEAGQTVFVPVRFTLKDKPSGAKGVGKRKVPNAAVAGCMASIKDDYKRRCGKDLKDADPAFYKWSMRKCVQAAILSELFGSIGGGKAKGDVYVPDGPNTPRPDVYPKDEGQDKVGYKDPICDPNFTKCGMGIEDRLEDMLPGGDLNNDALKRAQDAADAAKERQKNNPSGGGTGGGGPNDPTWDIGKDVAYDTAEKMAKQALKNKPGLPKAPETTKKGESPFAKPGEALAGMIQDCLPYIKEHQNTSDAKPMLRKAPTVETYDFEKTVRGAMNVYYAWDAACRYIYGDDVWYSGDLSDKLPFFEFLDTLSYEQSFNKALLLAHKPESVSKAQLFALIERLHGDNVNNCINPDSMKACVDTVYKYQAVAESYGYTTYWDMYRNTLEEAYESMTNSSGSMCSSVSLQFKQSMVLTRQAFRGTLTVSNGSTTTAMTDVKLNLTITNIDGNVATSHEFQTSLESLDTFEGDNSLTSGWSLAADGTGTATILFIPTRYAAETTPEPYSFGGTISYVDPFTGLEVTRQLTPVTLTVNPSPVLDMTYFMQRDIIGDDPLTTEVEPMEEAEFALLMHNTGYGDATNVNMVTQQPEIVDNQKGLAVKFEITGSSLNGGEKSLALGGSIATDFGTIHAQGTAYAQWWLTSTLLGHFTSYNIEATHVTSYDNPDLSLLGDVSIHELIRSVDAGDGMVGFLVNDIPDDNDNPDILYRSDGETEDVSMASSANINKGSNTEYTLTVTPTTPGWNYASIPIELTGKAEIASVRRGSDGKEISLRNVWLTDRTLHDGKDPVYENRIHIADDFSASATETYTVTFKPMPDITLAVDTIEGVPTEGTILDSQIGSVTVKFNKAIDATTFTTDDITLTVQGVAASTADMTITVVDDRTFTLGIAGLDNENGYYVLTVQTAGITDTDGYQGQTGKTAGWTLYNGGKVYVSTSVIPEGAGSLVWVSPEKADAVEYGTNVSLQVVPNTGYTFVKWMLNGDSIGNTTTVSRLALSDLSFVAHFVKDTSTGIDGIEIGPDGCTVVTLQGVVVARHADKAALRRLQKGVYIVDGKKVVIE